MYSSRTSSSKHFPIVLSLPKPAGAYLQKAIHFEEAQAQETKILSTLREVHEGGARKHRLQYSKKNVDAARAREVKTKL